VEYVQECIVKNGGNLSDLYKCSCAIDRMAEHLTYDDFVEAGTFAAMRRWAAKAAEFSATRPREGKSATVSEHRGRCLSRLRFEGGHTAGR